MWRSESAITAVFFDFDGVVTTDPGGMHTVSSALGRAIGIPTELVLQAFSPFIGDLVMGHKTHAQVWPEICAALGRPVDLSGLREAFGCVPLNEPMLHLARALRPRYAVGMITDNPSDRIAQIVEVHGLDVLFDPIVVSGTLGISKRSHEIFNHALTLVQKAPCETIFIDNSEPNIRVAREVGIEAIFHDDSVNDVSLLVSTLVERYGLVLSGATQSSEPTPLCGAAKPGC